MDWLRKILHRGDHEKWLEEHPGKGAMANLPSSGSDDDARKSRELMEREMAQDTERARARNEHPAAERESAHTDA